MANQTREKLATQVDAGLLTEIRALARSEGQQIQSFVDEALTDLLEKRRQERPRKHVMVAYQASHEEFGTLYKKLAD